MEAIATYQPWMELASMPVISFLTSDGMESVCEGHEAVISTTLPFASYSEAMSTRGMPCSMTEDMHYVRTIFSATPKAFTEFMTLLDAMPQPGESLRRTMHMPLPWE